MKRFIYVWIFLIIFTPFIYGGQDNLIVPWFKVHGELIADSLALRAMSVTSISATNVFADSVNADSIVCWQLRVFQDYSTQETVPGAFFRTAPKRYQTGGDGGVDESFDDVYEAVKITADSSYPVKALEIKMKRTGVITNGADYVSVAVRQNNAGEPGSVLATSTTTIPFYSLDTSYDWYLYNIDISFTASTIYWITLNYSSAPVGGTIEIDSETTGTGLHSHSADGSSWTNEDSKFLFVYMRGESPNAIKAESFISNTIYSHSYSGAAYYGYSDNGYGGDFYGFDNIGVRARSDNGTALSATSTYGTAVLGSSTSGYGLSGVSYYTSAVRGSSTDGDGGYFLSTNGRALRLYRNTETNSNPVQEIHQDHAGNNGIALKITQDGTGDIIDGGVFKVSSTGIISANPEYSSFIIAIDNPDGMASDTLWAWQNTHSGTATIDSIMARCNVDDYALTLAEQNETGGGNAVVHAITIDDDGSDCYYKKITSVTGASIENEHWVGVVKPAGDSNQINVTVYYHYTRVR